VRTYPEVFAEKYDRVKGFIILEITMNYHKFSYLKESNCNPPWNVFQEITGIDLIEK